jgi:hypothetical protein
MDDFKIKIYDQFVRNYNFDQKLNVILEMNNSIITIELKVGKVITQVN